MYEGVCLTLHHSENSMKPQINLFVFNFYMTEAPIINNSVHWYSEQITGLFFMIETTTFFSFYHFNVFLFQEAYSTRKYYIFNRLCIDTSNSSSLQIQVTEVNLHYIDSGIMPILTVIFILYRVTNSRTSNP